MRADICSTKECPRALDMLDDWTSAYPEAYNLEDIVWSLEWTLETRQILLKDRF